MTKTKPIPRLPNVETARKLVHSLWIDPTEDGLQQVRRMLVRRMWQARKVQHLPGGGQPSASQCRAELRRLYVLVLQRQAARDWEIDDAERRSRERNRNNPSQYARELVQRQKGSAALLTLNVPASPSDHAYQAATASVQPVIIYQGAGQTESPAVLTATHRNRRTQSLHRMAVHHLARVLYLAHFQGWHSLSLTSTYGTPSDQARPLSKGGVEFGGTLCIEGVLVRVSTIITTDEYNRALARLTNTQQGEIRSYYRRNPAAGDFAPEVESWTYQDTVVAFDALLHALYDQGSLKR